MCCPSCGSRLVEIERADVPVDACPECRRDGFVTVSDTVTETSHL
jgi:Zn-finger nucleic acid-binding protein